MQTHQNSGKFHNYYQTAIHVHKMFIHKITEVKGCLMFHPWSLIGSRPCKLSLPHGSMTSGGHISQYSVNV